MKIVSVDYGRAGFYCGWMNLATDPLMLIILRFSL